MQLVICGNMVKCCIHGDLRDKACRTGAMVLGACQTIQGPTFPYTGSQLSYQAHSIYCSQLKHMIKIISCPYQIFERETSFSHVILIFLHKYLLFTSHHSIHTICYFAWIYFPEKLKYIYLLPFIPETLLCYITSRNSVVLYYVKNIVTDLIEFSSTLATPSLSFF